MKVGGVMNRLKIKLLSITFTLAMVLGTIAMVDSIEVKAEDSEYDFNTATITNMEETCDSLKVEGFQIRTSDADIQKLLAGETAGGTAENPLLPVTFRAVLKGPNLGSTISVGGTSLTIIEYGTIYAIDTFSYNPSFSLNETKTRLDTSIGNRSTSGEVKIINNGYTLGYINSQKAICNGWDDSDTNTTYYATFMENMNGVLSAGIQVRPFVIAKDSEGNIKLVYGTDYVGTSVAAIGYHIYTSGKARNYNSHRYIYKAICHSQELASVKAANPSFPYYLGNQEDYGWVDNLYTNNGVFAPERDLTMDD